MSFVRDQLEQEVQNQGPIPFIRFMETALYCPEAGYYEQICHTPGRLGDFFTSVSVGPVFGGLIARELCRWIDGMGPGAVALVEGGAHDGQLAQDILQWMDRCRPDCRRRLHYTIVEPSTRRRSWQQARLSDWGDDIEWVGDWVSLAKDGVRGVILTNELLDAMPVVRLGWDPELGSWFEWGVGWGNEGFCWVKMARTTVLPELAESWLQTFSERAGDRLLEGSVMEFAPGALAWWAQAARALREGYLVAFDYGWDETDGWRLASPGGTLRGFRRHRMAASVLDCPGEQDLTAHVNWGLIRLVGEEAGLSTVGLTPQGRWLSRVAAQAVSHPSPGLEWTPSEVRQFQMLTHPEHLGVRFQVLVQGRGSVFDSVGAA